MGVLDNQKPARKAWSCLDPNATVATNRYHRRGVAEVPTPKTRMLKCKVIEGWQTIDVQFNRCNECGAWFQSLRAEALYCPQGQSLCRDIVARRKRKAKRDAATNDTQENTDGN